MASNSTYSKQLLKDVIGTSLAFIKNEEEESEKSQWIQSLNDVLNQGDECKHIIEYSNNQSEVSGLLRLLRECLLTHRFQDVVKILLALLNESSPAIAGEAISKVGMEVMFKNERGTSNLLSQFVTQLQSTCRIYSKEVVLNYALYLLLNGQTKAAKEQFQSATVREGQPSKDVKRREYINQLFNLYQGVLWYVEWVQTKHIIQDLRKKASAGSLGDSGGNLDMEITLLHSHAEKAVQHFADIKDTPGVWDIFVLKHVEILEDQEQFDCALKVLKSYSTKNPDNPNTYWYLYEFYKRNNYDLKFQMDYLKKFCDAIPSHEAAFTLHNHMITQGSSPAAAIYLIFDVLDYVCWRDKVRPWKILAQQLMIIADVWQTAACPELVDCWNCRVSWWPQFHFRHTQLAKDKADKADFRVNKAIVASYLLGPENDYTEGIRQEELQDEDRQRLEDATSKKLLLC